MGSIAGRGDNRGNGSICSNGGNWCIYECIINVASKIGYRQHIMQSSKHLLHFSTSFNKSVQNTFYTCTDIYQIIQVLLPVH